MISTATGQTTRPIFAAGPVAQHAGEAFLYCYTYHGSNVFPFEHHWRLIVWRAPPAVDLRGRQALLQTELDRAGWFRSAVRICGRDGLAFVYPPGRNDEKTSQGNGGILGSANH
ncbi:MAG: hypothetical protein K2R98_26155 [Gemmataceae bacterium]|nr:hypothetical protein [Gemmataceae bacterium]